MKLGRAGCLAGSLTHCSSRIDTQFSNYMEIVQVINFPKGIHLKLTFSSLSTQNFCILFLKEYSLSGVSHHWNWSGGPWMFEPVSQYTCLRNIMNNEPLWWKCDQQFKLSFILCTSAIWPRFQCFPKPLPVKKWKTHCPIAWQRLTMEYTGPSYLKQRSSASI